MKILFNSVFLILNVLIINIITSFIYAQNAADYFVRSLPGLSDDNNLLKSHAGHINIHTESNTNIFFWLLHNKHIADKSRLIIWLNGGPGCSSMDGMFLENGPWRINGDQTLKLTNNSWNEYTNILYVDQPAGTGFSFANSDSYLTKITQIPTEFLLFLDKFFGIFPEFSQDEVYLAGESYSGTFIPYIAKAILDRNHARKTAESLKYKLKGIAIGNGWIDPVNQYNAYYTFAVEKNLLDGEYKTLATNQLKMCKDELNKQVKIRVSECEEILSTVLQSSRRRSGENENCVNLYDIRDYSDTYPSCGRNWPYELKAIKAYLRRSDVVGAIHADSQSLGWVECNGGVGRLFNDDIAPPSVTLLPGLLKNINVLLYNGDQDLICNTNGMKDMISNLQWNGFKGFKNNTAKVWHVNDQVVGEVTSERNLTYAVIYQASHMAPYDAPTPSLDIIYRFIGLNRNLTKQGFTSKVGDEDLITGTLPTDTETSAPKDWDKYYNAGTATLVIVIIAVVGLAIWAFRGKFMKRKRTTISEAMKAAVESENNEMEELVIETPLFQSDDVDHFGDSDEDEDDKQKRQSLENNIRERNQRYRDDSGNNSEERIRLRDSGDN